MVRFLKIVAEWTSIFALWLWGIAKGLNPLFWILCLLMVIDFATGWLVGKNNLSKKSIGGGLDSKIGWLGISKKIMTVSVILVATLLDNVVDTGEPIFQLVTIIFYISNEALSIVENAGLLGVGIPKKFFDFLEQLKEKNNNGA